MATFKINNSFYLPSRGLMVIAGEILSGEVRVGMALRRQINSEVSLAPPIDAIEFARTDRGEDVCLCYKVDHATPEDVEFIQLLFPSGHTYEVVELDAQT